MKKIFFGILFFAFFAVTQYWGLVIAPADRMMGDVYRIIYVHVPVAWSAIFMLSVSCLGCFVFLLTKRFFWDQMAVCAAEIGVVMTGLALVLGSIWGKPTWGVWWTWDPRLTTTAILFILYTGYLILRGLIEDPERRARLTGVVGLLIFLNVPIVYMSVRWWRTLHQVQSSSKVMDPQMFYAMEFNFTALLLLMFYFLVLRMQIAKKKRLLEEEGSVPPPLSQMTLKEKQR